MKLGIYNMAPESISFYENILVNVVMFQAERVRDAAWGCDWVGTPIPFQKCIRTIIAAANNEVTLTAGKFVPVTIRTLVNVSLTLPNPWTQVTTWTVW
jgi:hypothetical protein